MPHSQIQSNENRRHPAPEEFHILKTSSNKDFSDLLFLCAETLKAQGAALVILENGNTWIKSSYGASHKEIPEVEDLWQEILDQEEIIVFTPEELSKKSIDFNGLAAVPLKTVSGEKLGIIAIFEPQEMPLSPNQEHALQVLVKQILNVVGFRKQNNLYKRMQQDLEQRYRELERFASVVSHDIKSPLANIISLIDLLKEENQDIFNEDTKQYIEFLSQASHSLRSYVDGLLVFYRSERILEKEEEDVELKPFFDNLTKLFSVDPEVEITYPQHGILKKVNKAALTQIFMNLISNALKYNHKDQRRVNISFRASEDFYEFEVQDNGNGISEENFEKIFDLFTTLDLNDREGNPGSGIGLATVKKLLNHMGGDIQIESEPEIGSNFIFQIKRSC
ncbi:sensor histidine kinase [Salinimicrobium oceani]|uniref:histidine kinase n=1 Tax=Salinimicrobium oceani TaxID=2722702 RepID=A0ABX1CYH1_9FLAO|nr:ATP-binding protein [Salinimicrobium oceani]NJW53315.1 HAMP domain-containing histidine kinase [Salinimicrobium oceani]